MSDLPGSSASPILILTSLAILLGAALSRRAARPSAAADRWAVASGALLVLSTMRVAAGPLLETSRLVPLLDRLFGVFLPAGIAWASIESPGHGVSRAVAASLGASGLLFAASAAGASEAARFNASPFDLVWSLWGVTVSTIVLAVMVARRPPVWAVFGSSLLVLAAGHLGHIAFAPPNSAEAPYILLASAVATPMCTLGAVGLLVRQAPVERPAPRPTADGLVVRRALQATVGAAAASTADEFAAALTQALGSVLRGEITLMLTPPRPDGGLSIAAGYSLIRDRGIPAAPLDTRACPVFAQAMRMARSVYLPADTRSPDAATVLRAIGLAGKSPALLVPLPFEGRVVGGILLLSPHAQQEWTADIREAMERASPAIGERLGRLAMTAPTESVPRAELQAAQRHVADLESRLSRRAADADPVGTDDLRAQLDESRRAIEILEAEIDRLRPPAAMPPRLDEGAQRLRAELALALEALAEARAASHAPASDPAASAARDGPGAVLYEVRQPLTTIAGYTDLLLGESIGLLGATQRRFLERIRAAVRRMDEELAALAAAVRRGHTDSAAAEPSDFGPLVEQALESIHADLRAKSLSVRLDLPPGRTPVSGDPTVIRTIVARLLTNAAGTSPAGREILLSVLRDHAQGVVVLTVSDAGPGIAPEDRSRLFGEEASPEPVRGLGLDAAVLATVRALAESVGGRVWVESPPTGGMTFSVLLPAG